MAQKIDFETSYTEQQLELLNKMEAVCNKAKELEENSHGYVVAGHDGAGTDYCYCGEGKGYKGAPLRPSCIWAVVFNTEEEALNKVRELTGCRNGYGHEIKLDVMVAWYYFSLVRSQMLGSIDVTKRMFQEINNNKI